MVTELNTLPHLQHLLQSTYCEDGIFSTCIPQVSIIRSSRPLEPIHLLHEPAVCIVISGKKEIVVGSNVIQYGECEYVVVSVDMPISGQVTKASENEPYLCFKIDLDPKLLCELLLAYPFESSSCSRLEKGVRATKADDSILNTLYRMAQLLSSEQDALALSPLMKKEIMYWMLKGEQGEFFRQLAETDSRLQQIAKAIKILKDTFTEKFDIDVLLSSTNMSSACFFTHFKMITHMSPLQYQKKLRLQEARRLIYMNSLDISTAGYHVGYESPSQFTREYARLFGLPPSRDIARLKSNESIEQKLL